MSPRRSLLIAFMCAITTAHASAQTILDRTPNLAGAWVSAPGVLHFNFLHRFSSSSAPERKVTSTPTFLLAAGLPLRTLLGAHYASNSELSPGYPNEWELFGRFAALDQESGSPVDVSVQVGYNLAAEGLDGEAALARRQGPVRILAALRVLTDPGVNGGTDVALGSGLVVRLTRHLALSADVSTLTRRSANEEVAWSAGVNLAIPRTPHTLSLHATNVNNATLQSSSRGTAETRYGFEFTIPLTLSRYFGDGGGGRPRGAPVPPAKDPGTDTTIAGGNTVPAAMEDFIFRPGRIEVAAGTTVEWRNQGQVVHTVTAEDRSFDSGNIEPGARHRVTFARPGTYSYHCTPHPFMRGVVVVR